VRSTYPAENSVLLMQFRQFCSELLRLREMVEQRYPPGVAEGPLDPAAPPVVPKSLTLDEDRSVSESSSGSSQWTGATPAENVRQSLLALLEQQSQRSADLGGALGLGLFREAEYIMAALADELFLNAHWSGRNHWPLLEQEIFQTHASGDLFFQKLDRLLSGNATNSNDLAMIYFQALALDFRGRYRDADPQGQLERYRHRLYFRVYHSTADEGAREPIFLETYDETVNEGDIRRLSSPHLWWFVLAGICAVWFFASTLLWRHVTADIRQQIDQIRASSQTSESVPQSVPESVQK
jgi:type VI secretion system protein ImpK